MNRVSLSYVGGRRHPQLATLPPLLPKWRQARDDGRVGRTNRVFANVSRAEVARRYANPAPAALLDELVRRGELSVVEAELASEVPVATNITAGEPSRRGLAVNS